MREKGAGLLLLKSSPNIVTKLTMILILACPAPREITSEITRRGGGGMIQAWPYTVVMDTASEEGRGMMHVWPYTVVMDTT